MSSKFELDTSGSGYHGRVTEDATVVSVTPQIRVDPSNTDQMVCGFAIINHRKHHDDIPFEVRSETLMHYVVETGQSLDFVHFCDFFSPNFVSR